MRKHSFVISAIILALGGFFAKGIGALYKIPLTNILGSNGMGLYYLVFPIYSLIMTFCSSGISVALATEVAKCRKVRHKYNEQKLLRVALVLSFVLSLFFTLIVVFLSRPLALAQGNINAYAGYIAISPAIILSSIISTLRGYFQGIENMIPTTISLIVEQIIKLTLGLVLAKALCVYGIQYAVLGAILGVTISEIIALIIIAVNFFTYSGQLDYNYRNKFYKRRRAAIVKSLLKGKKIFTKQAKFAQSNLKETDKEKHVSQSFKVKNCNIYKCLSQDVRLTSNGAIRRILKITIPSTFASLVIPVATMLDSFMIINLLINVGYSSALSTSLYGLSGGVVQSLISVPIILIAAVSTALVPSLSGIVARNDTNEIKHKVGFFIKLTWILAIPMFVLIFAFSKDILSFLYGDGLSTQVFDELMYTTKMLQIGSVSILYYAFLQTFTAILQTIGKSHVPFIALLVSLVVRTVLLVLLVSTESINIFGVFIANTIFLIIATVAMAIVIKNHIAIEFRFYRNLILPFVVGGVVLFTALLLHRGLKSLIGTFFSMVTSGLAGVVIYLLVIWFGGVLNHREKKYLFDKKLKISKSKKEKPVQN